ncbi:MAG: hypothetical protein JJT96_02495 [Opitutales bacterium]|nr:hypothetical protein [Opitutales bacterium]
MNEGEGPLPEGQLARLVLEGVQSGEVRRLPGFRKGLHTVPDRVTPTTEAFLGKLCAPELEGEGEALFREARATFGYKRRDLSFSVSGPTGMLAARHFTLEKTYALDPSDPSLYLLTHRLAQLRGADPDLPAKLDALFPALFSTLLFPLDEAVSVEGLIDGVEALDENSPLTVDYPPDCRECTIRVPGVAAEAICNGHSLALRFPGLHGPTEIFTAFGQVRSAFLASGAGDLSALVRR